MKLFIHLFILLATLTPFCASAQEDDTIARRPDFMSRWEAGVRAGYMFTSNPILYERMLPEGKTTHTSLSGHLRYSFQKPNSGRNNSVYQGVGMSVTTFLQPEEVGTPFGLYVFQGAPIAVLSERLSVDYEWNFGATIGWKRTSSGSEVQSNLVVGSYANAYLNLGFKLNYALCAGLNLTGGLDLTHYSNGNTSWPNPGVNSIGGAIGLVYTPGAPLLSPRSPFANSDDFKQGVSYDLMAYGAWRKAYYPPSAGAFTEEGESKLLPGRFGVAGLTFAPMWDLHPTFRTGLSADFQWSGNTGLGEENVIRNDEGRVICVQHPSFFRQTSVGLSTRAELVMPIFSLNVGIGYGLLGPSETKKLYQTINLKTHLVGPLFLNVGYRMLQFHSPSNLMLGLGVTLPH